MGKKKSDLKSENSLILPFIALDNYVVSPLIPQPVKIELEDQKKCLEKCSSGNSEIFIATSDVSHNERRETREENLKKLGIVCALDKILQMPGAPTLAFIRPLYRAQFNGIVYSPSCPMAKIEPLKQVGSPKRISPQQVALMERIDSLYSHVMQFAGDPERQTADKLIEENSIDPLQHLYAVMHVAPLLWEEKYSLLECNTFNALAQRLAISLDEAEQRILIQAHIHEKTHQEISRQQKENFLRVHLRQIREELGEMGENDDVDELIVKANAKKWDIETRQHFDKELQKLRKLNINNPEYSIQVSYLDTLLELPWLNYKTQDIDIDKVAEVLERDHYGLDKVKERVLEYMAVLKLRNDLKAPILCLYGPPGVGKTSIGKSIAEAVGREYARISLGGMHDEAEIRGHRRTYIGAMPGRFLQTLSKLKFGNPLMLLDEIDKVGKDYKGDPSSALLEALDPEQNNTFHDNFIDYPYDLSKVLFIATANDLSAIPPPLRDRMEVIEIPGYSLEEKTQIALRHLIDKALADNGFEQKEITFSQEAVETIIKKYTHEKGVRQLWKAINRILRKLALQKVKGLNFSSIVSPEVATQFLDNSDFSTISVGFR